MTLLKHYRLEFIKHVFPKLFNPHIPFAEFLTILAGGLTLYFLAN